MILTQHSSTIPPIDTTCMAVELFPRELTRKQYGLRLFAVFAFVIVGLWLFVAALISGYVYYAWILIADAYAIFGLAVPRLRNAGQATWWALVFLIPYANIIATFVLLFIRERGQSQPDSASKLTADEPVLPPPIPRNEATEANSLKAVGRALDKTHLQ